MNLEKNMYTNINNKEELKSFLDEAGYFHDGVIKSINYVSGSYSSNGWTHPSDDKAEIIMVIEGCWCGTIKLKFELISKAVIKPVLKNFDSLIFGGNIYLKNNSFVFVKDVDNIEDDLNLKKVNSTYIVSKKLSYQIKN